MELISSVQDAEPMQTSGGRNVCTSVVYAFALHRGFDKASNCNLGTKYTLLRLDVRLHTCDLSSLRPEARRKNLQGETSWRAFPGTSYVHEFSRTSTCTLILARGLDMFARSMHIHNISRSSTTL